MAHGAFNVGIMFIRVDASDVRTPACRVGQREMTPEALRPAPVYRKLRHGVRRMIDGRTMAVFALYVLVGGFFYAGVVFVVAILAVFRTPVLDLELLPFFFVALPVPAVHVPPRADAEILWHDQGPGNEDKDNDADDRVERPENMMFHEPQPPFLVAQ